MEVMNDEDKIKIAGILERIEASQNALYKDVVELGTVDGFAEQWEELGEVQRSVKAVWHSINNRKGQLIQESRPKGPEGNGSQPNLPNFE